MNIKNSALSFFATLFVFVCSNTYADIQIDTNPTQLLADSSSTASSTISQQTVTTTGASDEKLSATLDQNGNWQIPEKPAAPAGQNEAKPAEESAH